MKAVFIRPAVIVTFSIYFYISIKTQPSDPVGLPMHAREHCARPSSAQAVTLLNFSSNQEPRDTQTDSRTSATRVEDVQISGVCIFSSTDTASAIMCVDGSH